MSAKSVSSSAGLFTDETYNIQDHNLHRTLLSIRFLILNDFHTDYLMRFQILAFDDLSKRSLAQHIQDQVLVSFASQYVINVEDIITVLVIVAVVAAWFRRFRQDSPWVQ